MSIKVKPGVEFAVIGPAGYVILEALKKATVTLRRDLTITSGTDGAHSGPTDPHKTGEAYDIRSHDFPADLLAVVLGTIMDELDPVHFYGFLEAPDTGNAHFHIQRRKGTTFGITELLA